jgi:hypothetical protein
MGDLHAQVRDMIAPIRDDMNSYVAKK